MLFTQSSQTPHVENWNCAMTFTNVNAINRDAGTSVGQGWGRKNLRTMQSYGKQKNRYQLSGP